MRAVPALYRDQLPMVCEYLRQRIGVDFDPKMCQGFAIMSDEGVFTGAVLISNVRFHGHDAIDCELSCASENSMAWKPEVLRAVFAYVFGQLGCARCTSVTRKNNTKARGFLEALNFTLEGNIRRGYDGVKDALIYGLLAEECRFYGD